MLMYICITYNAAQDILLSVGRILKQFCPHLTSCTLCYPASRRLSPTPETKVDWMKWKCRYGAVLHRDRPPVHCHGKWNRHPLSAERKVYLGRLLVFPSPVLSRQHVVSREPWRLQLLLVHIFTIVYFLYTHEKVYMVICTQHTLKRKRHFYIKICFYISVNISFHYFHCHDNMLILDRVNKVNKVFIVIFQNKDSNTFIFNIPKTILNYI